MALYTAASSRQGTRSGISSLAGPLILLAVAVVLSAVSRRAVTHLARWSDIYALVLICAAFAGASEPDCNERRDAAADFR